MNYTLIQKKSVTHQGSGLTDTKLVFSVKSQFTNRQMEVVIPVDPADLTGLQEGKAYKLSFTAVAVPVKAAKSKVAKDPQTRGPVEPYTEDPIGDKAHSHDDTDAAEEIKPTKEAIDNA